MQNRIPAVDLKTITTPMGRNTTIVQVGNNEGNTSQEAKPVLTKADVSTETTAGCALILASKEGHRDVVQLLLEAGANVNSQGGHISNALQAASLDENAEMVQMLLNANADINIQEYGNGSHKSWISMGGLGSINWN